MPESDFPALRANDYRDAWCGQVLADRVGGSVRVAGWVHRRRDHGGLIFVDLRDRTGLVQLVFNPDAAGDAHELGHRLRSEDVISAVGEVVRRDPEMVNPDIPTGEDDSARSIDVFVAAADARRESALALVRDLRGAGLSAELDLAGRGLKGQMKQADRVGARRAVILGDDGGCVVRDMDSGEQSEADPSTVVSALRVSAG